MISRTHRRRRRRPRLAALVLLCLAGCTPAGQASTSEAAPATLRCAAGAVVPGATPAVGAQFHGTYAEYTDAERARVVDLMAQTGLGWLRIDAQWSDLQPRSAARWDEEQLARLDTTIRLAREHGLQVLVTFVSAPGWAGGGPDATELPRPSAYATAIGALAARYQGEVAAWEVWNEPDGPDAASDPDPVAYTQLLRAASPAVKAADPAALVVFGGTVYNDAPFVAGAYAAGAGGFFDVMATHPYPAPSDSPPTAADDGTPYSLGHVRAVRQLMVDNGDAGKPIWFTEIGWSTHANTGDEQPYERGVTERQQADHLVRTLELVGSSFPYVDHVFWYAATDRSSGPAQLAHFGLLTRTLEPKQSAQALACHLRSDGTPAAPGG